MSQKGITLNISLTGTGILGFLGGVLPTVLKSLGKEDLAGKIETALSPEKSVDRLVNLTPLYLWIFILCAVALSFINWDLISKKIKQYKQSKLNSWDMTVYRAVNYILYRSHFGESLTGEDKDQLAFHVLVEAIRNGRLPIAGIKPDSLTLQKIPTKEIKSLFFHLKKSHDKEEAYTNARITSDEKGDNGMHFKLFLDKRDLERLWPPHYRSSY